MTKQGNQHTADSSVTADDTEEALADRFRYRRLLRRNRALNLTYRITVGVVGTAIIAVGIVLLPLPGPGWLIIFAGLFVLGTEFEWAERLLHFARRQVGAWTDWVKRQSLLVRALIGLGCLLIVAGAVWGYVAWQGVPEWLPYIG